MTDDALTPDELDDQNAEALPDREAMSVIAPIEGTVDGDEILFPAEPDIGDPALPT
jgi:hypothetical protein